MMSLWSSPHHDGSPRYVSTPQPGLGERVAVFVLAPLGSGVDRVYARSIVDGEPVFTAGVVDRVDAGGTWWRAGIVSGSAVVRYRFLLLGRGGRRWLTAAGVVDHDVPDGTDFRLVTWDAGPDWANDAVVYQIFPDRFARSIERKPPDWAVPCDWDDPVVGRGPETPYQIYGGDLDGVVHHLDHIQSLGADTIYLTPIFPARSNHRYDAAAFDQVDPLLGGDEALVRLAGAAHERGLRLVGDLTTNHCGQTHPWFEAAWTDPAAPERDMFYIDGEQYACWLDVATLPKLNWNSDLLRQRLVLDPDAIATRWLRPPYGLDGWRVDVANMTGRYQRDDLTHDVARLLRRTVSAARPDAVLIAEHGHDASGDLDRDGWQGTMNYGGFTRPLWTWLSPGESRLPDFLGVPGGVPEQTGRQVVASMRAFAANISWRSLRQSWTMLDSHDTARLRNVVGDPAHIEVALGLQLTYPGVPMIFAGAELGLPGANGEDARRPMPWHRPETWDRTALAQHRALIALRRAHPALRSGGLRWAHVDDDSMAYVREGVEDRLLVYARRASGEPVVLAGFGSRCADNLYGGASPDIDEHSTWTLPGDGPTVQVWRLG